ncbi:MAG: TetR/AcrR family transcriptional regulator [Alphaproteobacteria bacterium]|nr:TetR/AcrR family transcriptional regulator [Alphaproteobacteria bacterium]
MPVAPRSRLTNDDRRAQLLELGERLFSQRAYDEISIDDIATEAGISKGLLYHYFGGKRAFYTAVVAQAAERLIAATHPDPTLPGRARALAGLSAYLDFVQARASAFIALMRGGLGHDPEIRAIIESVRADFEARSLEGLGLDGPRPVYRTAVRAWIGAVEMASLDWLEHRHIERDVLLALLLGSLAGHVLAAHRLDPDAAVDLDDVRALLDALGDPP